LRWGYRVRSRGAIGGGEKEKGGEKENGIVKENRRGAGFEKSRRRKKQVAAAQPRDKRAGYKK
jgi:hypothetical protein